MERRNYGIADDIYAAGLLLAYMTFLPFSEPGSIDGASLQVLLCRPHFTLDMLFTTPYVTWFEASYQNLSIYYRGTDGVLFRTSYPYC